MDVHTALSIQPLVNTINIIIPTFCVSELSYILMYIGNYISGVMTHHKI